MLGWVESLSAKRKRRLKKKHGFFSHKVVALIAVALIVIIAAVAYQIVGKTNSKPTRIALVTSMGGITIELYDDMPITSGNFKNLTEHGIYDATIFHRVSKNPAVIQGGDVSAKGITVPTIPDELPNKHKPSNVRGSVAMAKTSAPNSATSQFYINLKDNLDLDSNYSVFGKVIAGMDVVDAIGNVQTDNNDKPSVDVIVYTVDLMK
jgi:peptidylprolyl isomerase